MWDQTGLGADREKSAQRFGLEPMDSTEALAALRHLLSTQALQKTVAAVDWPVLKPLYEAKRVRPFLEKILLPRESAPVLPGESVPNWRSELEQARPSERWEKLAMNVEKEAAFVMGFPPSGRLDRDRGFFEMGMDSLISVELKKRLESRVGRTLPSTVIFNYPTIHRLTGYLGKEILGLPADEQAAAAAAAAAASVLDLEIGRLTDAEVKASLLKELEGAGY
jgi:myxalamid-type polyketide synthase MxaE and MxaD